MKVKKLILENINSLYGRWEIDFSDPKLAQNGIFAIIGATGTGKTSILDAMCLALYGETPRIDRGASTIGEVINKSAGSCFAELTFESKGKNYIATFEIPKVSRGSNAGTPNLQKITYKISCDGVVLAEKAKDVLAKVIELTSLDKDAFCRSVMLPQGKFDAFLTADKNEKEALLTQITGVAIYDQIAEKLKDLKRDAEQNLNTKKVELEQLNILSPGEEKQKQNDLAALNNSQKTLSADCKTMETTRDNLRQKMDKDSELQKAKNEFAQAQIDSDNAKADSEKLGNAQKVQVASEWKGKMDTANNALKENKTKIDDNKTKTKTTKNAIVIADNNLNAAEKALGDASEEEKNLTPVLTDIRRIIAEIKQKNEAKKDIESDGAKAKGELEKCQAEQAKNKQSQDALTKGNKADEDYLTQHSADKDLTNNQARWEEQLKRYLDSVIAYKKSSNDKNKAEKDLKDAEKHKADCEMKKQETEEQKRNADANLDDLNKKLFAAGNKEELEKELDEVKFDQQTYQQINDMEAQRALLKDGEPCSLCGSTVHPFAKTIPEKYRESKAKKLAELTQKLNNIKTLEKDIAKRQLDCSDKEGKANLAKQACDNAVNAYNNAKSIYDNACNTIGDLENAKKQLKAELSNDLNKFGFVWDGENTLPADVQKRIDEYNKRTASSQAYQQKMRDLQSEADQRDVSIQHLGKTLQEKLNKVADLAREIEVLQKDRENKFGTKDPDAEEKAARKKCEECSKRVTDCKVEKTTQDTALKALEDRAKELEAEKAKLEPQYADAEKAFQAECVKIGLSAEDIEKMAMPIAEQTALLGKINRVNNALENCRENLRKAQDAFDQAKALVTTNDTLNDLENALKAKKEELDAVNQEIGGLNQELKTNEIAKKKSAHIQSDVVTLQKTYDSWVNLNDIIGANKIKNFAHTVTLDALLVQTNEELQKLNNRYKLTRDKSTGKDDFSINVIDYEEGGIERTVSNLSGGERFIVSLALALGLCKLNARTMRIDSLFLDEGFGSLDEETCRTVMIALDKLRSQGKTIGIITHVPTVEDMMHDKVLRVESIGGGKSKISGPGVKQLTPRQC